MSFGYGCLLKHYEKLKCLLVDLTPDNLDSTNNINSCFVTPLLNQFFSINQLTRQLYSTSKLVFKIQPGLIKNTG